MGFSVALYAVLFATQACWHLIHAENLSLVVLSVLICDSDAHRGEIRL